jgi:phosphoenolpyruvate carboxykinase (ATP)
VKDVIRDKEIAWGDVNKPMSEESFQILSGMAKSYLNTRRKIYVVDGYAGWCQ